MTGPTNWQEWKRRWDRQQSNYLPHRERALDLMLDVVEGLVGSAPRLLDLGCGPGSLIARVAERLRGAELVGVDLDPFLLEMARNAAPTCGAFIQVDFCQEGWDLVLDRARFDAVCSASVIHYLHPSQISPLIETLALRLRPGGVLVIVDTLRLGHQHRPRLDRLAVGLREHLWDNEDAADNETWREWWQSARAEAAFGELLRRRDEVTARLVDHEAEVTLAMVTGALEAAGFTEVASLHQVADHHMVVAIR